MSDNVVDPIAWVRANGNVVIVGSSGEYETALSGIYKRGAPLPADAVPLIPATDVEKAHERGDNWRSRCKAAQAEADRLKAEKLPALDTPEALRYAADVMQESTTVRHGKDFVDADMVGRSPFSLRKEADQVEAAAGAEAERDERAQAVHLAYINGTTGIGLKWDLLTDAQRNGWRAVADHLDPSQAKAWS